MSHRVEHLADGVTLYLGDCREVLPALGKVDAIVTDPPYELSSAGPGSNHCFGDSLGKFDSIAYKSIVSGFDHEAVFGMLEAICRPFNLFCFCSNKQISAQMAYHEARGRSTNLLVWHKSNAVPFANGVWRGDIEYCIHAKDSGAVFVGNAQEKKKVSEFPLVIDDAHPTVKPLQLIRKYVRICSHPGQTILDPYCGSGTTGIACVQEGRGFIGVEIDPAHYETALRRVAGALAAPSFLVERPAPPKQEALGL